MVNTIHGQDILVRQSGEDEKVKVLEISEEKVKFKKWNNLDGPTYSLDKSEIFMIKYQNGEKETFTSRQDMSEAAEKYTNDVSDSQDNVVQEPERPKKREYPLSIGIGVSPSMNSVVLKKSYYEGVEYKGDRAGRFSVGAEVNVEYFTSEYGDGFLYGGMNYFQRGGALSSGPSVNMDYVGLNFGGGMRDDIWYWRSYMKIGFLQKAEYVDVSGASDDIYYDYANGCSLDLCTHIGVSIAKNIDLGFDVTIGSLVNLIKPEFWVGQCSTKAFDLGLTLTYRFDVKKVK